jgi:DNA-binding transcriptional LysR family regulator
MISSIGITLYLVKSQFLRLLFIFDMRSPVNLRQIEAFRAVMLRRTMTAAARELRTSQPSMSRLIAELEASIQLRLFERHAGRLTPTEEGLAFYREVEHSFAGLDNLAQAAKDIRLFGTGRLRLAAMPALALGFIPEVVRTFRQHFPKVTISLQMRSEATVTRWTSAHYCDIGFVANIIEAASVEVHPLYRLAGVCALPPGHRLARRKTIGPKDLEGESFISQAIEDGARARVDRVFEQAGIQRSMTLESPYGATICALVEQGLGIGIVNPIVAHDYRRSDIVFRPFEPSIHFHGNALLPQYRPKSVLIDEFIAIAKAAIEKHSGNGT